MAESLPAAASLPVPFDARAVEAHMWILTMFSKPGRGADRAS
jgi:hypothetical protein